MAQASSVLLSGFVHLVLSQVCTRLITFALSLLNARLLTPEAYGLFAVQYHLINTTILFLSREGFRRGCLRIKQDRPRSALRTLATAGLCLPLGAAVTSGVCAASLHFQDPAAKDASIMRQAVLLQSAAAFLELCSEPLYILATSQLKFRLRMAAEAAAAVARGGHTLWLLRTGSVHPARALTEGQMAYAGMLLGVYGGHYLVAWVAQELEERNLKQALAERAAGLLRSLEAERTAGLLSSLRIWEDKLAKVHVLRKQPAASKMPELADRQEQIEAQIRRIRKELLRPNAARVVLINANDGIMLETKAVHAKGVQRPGPALLAASAQELAALQEQEGETQIKMLETKAVHTKSMQKSGPAQEASPRLLDRSTLSVCATFTVQAGEKLLLAEGSKLVMAAFEDSHAQGVYGLVTNLGSLVVRTLFQPIEEAAFLSFSMSGEGQSDPQKARQQGLQILMLVLRCVTLIGLVATAFGPSYAYLLLRLLYGRLWSDTEAPAALGWYCPYIALLAVNGITEAYLHATAQGRQLTLANAWLIVCSLLHMALSVTLVKSLGTKGLIIADSGNMVLRILYSVWFIQTRAARQQLLEWAPHRTTLVLLAAAAFIAGASNKAFMATHQQSSTPTSWALPVTSWVPDLATGSFSRDALLHITAGVGCVAVVIGTMLTSEQAVLTKLRQLRKGSHDKMH